MRPLRLLGLLFGAMFAQWFCSTYLSVAETGPQLLLLLTVAVAAVAGPVAGQCFGFLWGLFLDFLSSHVFGANAMVLVFTAYFVGRLRRQMDVTGAASQAILAAVLAPAHHLAVGLLGMVFEHAFLWVGWKQLLAAPIYAAILAPLAFRAAERNVGGRP